MNAKQIVAVETRGAPTPNVPLAQATRYGDLVFTSGQVANDPETGEFVGSGIEIETRRVLDNLAAVLDAAGSSMNRVLKATVFLTDVNDFAAFNGVYASYFPDRLPARSTFVVQLAGPYKVEIELVAAVTEGK